MTYLLLLLNALVLAAGIGAQYLVAGMTPALNEFNAGKIRFWAQPDSYKPAAAKHDGRTARPPEKTSRCLEIAGLSQVRYLDMQALLKASGLAGGQCAYRFDRDLSWWVFWPPEYEAARRDKVLKAIRAAGVKDVLPIAQGAMAQSFSLGVFADEAQANRFRDELRGKGLDKVEFGPRPSLLSGRLGCVSSDAALLDGFMANLPSWATAVEAGRCGLPGEPQN